MTVPHPQWGQAANDRAEGAPPYVAWPETLSGQAEIGGKAAGLLALVRGGLPVPEWFVVLPSAHAAALAAAPAGPTTADGTVPAAALPLPPAVARALRQALAILSPGGEPLAVRSSALGEDSTALSFAGQFETRLWVRPEEVPKVLADIWASGFAARVAAYRQRVADLGPPLAPAVIVQRQIAGEASGVAFSADPVSARRGRALVAAIPGVGEKLVAGRTDADTWAVDREGGLELVHRAGAATEAPILRDDEVREVAALARAAEHLFGRPQDIEWTRAGGRLYLLQSRPITTLAGIPDPDAPLLVWDCTNIAENYGGTVTPLTFSFVRTIYREAYRASALAIGLGRRRIAESDRAFSGMIGLVRGRMYYNLVNWYRLLHLLPGYRWNRRFLESMLGLRARLPEALTSFGPPPRGLERWLELPHLLALTLRIGWEGLCIGRRVRRFEADLDDLLRCEDRNLPALCAAELAARYRQLMDQLSTRIAVPAFNDFWVMVFVGLSRRLALAWIGRDGEALCSDLLQLDRQSVSWKITSSIAGLRRLAEGNPPLLAALASESSWQIGQRLAGAPAFAAALDDHLRQYGDRVPGELKLETLTLHDDPEPLYRAIARIGPGQAAGAESGTPRNRKRGDAESRLRHRLGRRPHRRLLLRWLLVLARRRVRDREALRFTRARVFGLVRRLCLELGRRFAALGVLDEPRDIFYLGIEEALGFAEGNAVSSDLRGLAAIRKAECAAFASLPAPPVRFETRDVPYLAHAISPVAGGKAPAGDRLKGIGCSPGVVRGRVRILEPPAVAGLEPGDIVVANHTDPGWVTLLPACAGLAVEVGNPLSHAAIIARELGLPMVASVPFLTAWLRDGDHVVLDGGTGTITRISEGTSR